MIATKAPLLSVVIPAYNEENRILDTLEQVTTYLYQQSYSWEVLVVDDGSSDATSSLVEGFASCHSQVRLERLPHGGKGWAVKQGMLKACGQFRFMCDADLSMPIEQIARFLPPVLADYDIAIGSREVLGARRIGEPIIRYKLGRLFNHLVRLLVVPAVKDTQCGFKCFRGSVAQEIFPLQTVDGFAFDVEVLLLAQSRGMDIREVPIDWHYRDMSKVRILNSFEMLRDILRVKWTLLRGRYNSFRTSRNNSRTNSKHRRA